jgi:hypothetical protein
LKRTSGCFQNVGENVLIPEGSTLKTDMCKLVFGNYGLGKKSVLAIFEPPCKCHSPPDDTDCMAGCT